MEQIIKMWCEKHNCFALFHKNAIQIRMNYDKRFNRLILVYCANGKIILNDMHKDEDKELIEDFLTTIQVGLPMIWEF